MPESVSLMRQPCFILMIFVLLGFGMSLGFPAEDVLETAYDESQGPPYEIAPQFSIVEPQTSAHRTQAVPRSFHTRVGASSLFPSARVHDSHINRPAHVRTSLALRCTLLC